MVKIMKKIMKKIMNENSKTILESIPYDEYINVTNISLRCHKLNTRTVRNHLKKLLKQGLIERKLLHIGMNQRFYRRVL